MGRREQLKAARKQRIFEEAIRLFGVHGFDAVTVEEIATAAGIAKGTFFNYFPTKQAVLLHLNTLQAARLDALAAAPVISNLPFRAQVEAYFSHLAAGIVGRSDLVRIVIGQTLLDRAALDENTLVIRRHFEDLLVQRAAIAQERGELRSDVMPRDVARLLVGIYFLTVLDWLETPEQDLTQALAGNLRLAFDGIGGSGND